jgi:KaiC/GvpD/RAD55 family RecA-like ATPase
VPENTLPEALSAAITARGHKQSEAARILQRNESTISLYMSGKQVPSLRDGQLIQKLAEYIKVPAEEIQRLIENQRRNMVIPRSGAQPRIKITTAEVLRQAVAHLGLWTRLARFRDDPTAQQDVMLEQNYLVDKGLFSKLNLADATLKDNRSESLTRLLEPGLRHANDSALLNDYLRRFARDRWIRTAVRQVCVELNRAFESAKLDELPTAEVLDATTCAVRESLLSESNSPLTAQTLQAAQQHARALLLAVCNVRYLEENTTGTYRRRWKLYANFLINKLLGVPLHIEGLDFLLDGGLLLPSAGGLPVLIEGEAGSGKTMLALQMAASLASHSFLVIYLAAEERLESLVDRFMFMGFRPRPSSHAEFMFSRSLRPRNPADPPDQQDVNRPPGERLEFHFSTSLPKRSAKEIEKSLQTGKPGWIILSVIPNRREFWDDDSSFLRSVSDLLSDLGARTAIPRCLVVDSLDSVGSIADDRLSEEKAFRFVREQAEVSFLISGKQRSENTVPHRRHLCDLHFLLEHRVRTNDFDERTIEVVKSRSQSHMRGRHQMAIHGDRGIAVYPSVQAFLSVNRRRIRFRDDARPFRWEAPGIGLDEMLANDVVAGDSILLAGPPATHKFPLGLSFLAAGVVESADQPVMLISLRQDEPTVLRMVREYPQFLGLLEAHKKGNLTVIYEPPDYYTAERFLHWIRREFRRSQKRFSRVLFSTLNQLAYNSPMFGEEKLLVAALIELFRSNGATSLFLSSNRKQDEIENIFDAILFTEHEPQATGDRVLLSVGHSGPCNAGRARWVLHRQTTPERKGRLSLTPLVKPR